MGTVQGRTRVFVLDTGAYSCVYRGGTERGRGVSGIPRLLHHHRATSPPPGYFTTTGPLHHHRANSPPPYPLAVLQYVLNSQVVA